MMPFPEPKGDIRAQLAAVMDPDHPKRACFVVLEDAGQIPYVLNAFIETRPEGTLITTSEDWANAFRCFPSEPVLFDRSMAGVLGYPEAKDDVVQNCAGRPVANARAVQVWDADGWVIIEAFASPVGLQAAQDELRQHIPPGGSMVVLTPIEAIGRRLLLREAGN
jgi:hypothetical protein